jgi:ribonuclease M5
MRPEVIIDALRKAGATIEGQSAVRTVGNITKQDLVALGLSGGKNSGMNRLALLKKLELPEHMSCNAMLQALNLLMDLETLQQIVGEYHD